MHFRLSSISGIMLLICCGWLSGCGRDAALWQDPASGDPPATRRSVVIAPLAPGTLATVWPDGALDLTHRLATGVQSGDVVTRSTGGNDLTDIDGRVGDQLPSADAPAWSTGRQGASSAYLVVLARFTTFTDLPVPHGDSSISRYVQANLEVTALDRKNVEVFRRSLSGFGTDEGRAKLIGPMNAPESRAAIAAVDRAIAELREYLRRERDLHAAPIVAANQVITAPIPAECDLVIHSDPAQADILINGQFRGTTPQTIKVPVAPVTIRLERAGYKAWERQLTPAAGMTMNPVLDKTP